MLVNWSKARSSVVGLPAIPQRASIVFDDPAIDRVNGSVQTPLARARHVELHGRLADGSPPDQPVIETVLQIAGGSVQDLHPLLAQPFDADMRALLSGLQDLSPKPWPQRFREIQAAGGHVEIVQSRIEQGDLIAVAAGTLGLTANGRLDGELQMTVAGLEKVIPALGIEKMLDEGVPQATLDSVAPGVKTRTSTSCSARSTGRSPASARWSSRTPTPASPPASTRSARKRCWKAKRPAPSRCASSTARSISARSRSARRRRCFEFASSSRSMRAPASAPGPIATVVVMRRKFRGCGAHRTPGMMGRACAGTTRYPLSLALPDGQINRIACGPVPRIKNISAVAVGQITPTRFSIPPRREGRFAIVTNAGRDAVDAKRLLTNERWYADGEAVWS